MVSYEADILNNYNLNHLYNEWYHIMYKYDGKVNKYEADIFNKNVNKIDFVSPSADCSVVLR